MLFWQRNVLRKCIATSNKLVIRSAIVSFVILLALYLTIIDHNFPKFNQLVIKQSITGGENFHNQSNGSAAPMKKILIYNELYGLNKLFVGTGARMLSQNRCQLSRCQLFANPYMTRKRPLNSYDAVVFFIDVIFTEAAKIIKDLSKGNERVVRKTSQRYVALRIKPPVDPPVGYSIKKDLLVNFFNWSISYRQDADIQMPYGFFRPLRQGEERGGKRNRINDKSINGSSVVVAWMVSHCCTKSRREDYVKELRKHIDVDVYGDCGNLQCKITKKYEIQLSGCYDMIESKYKFYLSFENSICPDYVTEKFFRIAQLDSVVPVVLGGADYSRIAPSHSFIDARQFEPKQLAADDALFEEYLQWKDKNEVEASDDSHVRNAFCELCKKLHQDDVILKSRKL